MYFSCWITKATNTHSDYILLIAFPRQEWLGERASMLSYTCIASLVLPPPRPLRFSKSMESLPISVAFPLQKEPAKLPRMKGLKSQ